MIVERSGQFVVAGSYDATREYLLDAESVVQCLPDEVQSVTVRDDGAVDLVADVGPGMYKTAIKFRVRVADGGVNSDTITYTGQGLGPRSKVDLEGQFVLKERDDGTEVQWSGRADAGGIIASLNVDLTRVTADEKITETITNLESALNEQQ